MKKSSCWFWSHPEFLEKKKNDVSLINNLHFFQIKFNLLVITYFGNIDTKDFLDLKQKIYDECQGEKTFCE